MMGCISRRRRIGYGAMLWPARRPRYSPEQVSPTHRSTNPNDAPGRTARASALCGAMLLAVALPVHRAASGSTSTVCRLASYSTLLARRPLLQSGLRHRTVSAARLEGSQPLLTLRPAENEALPRGVTEGGKFAGTPVSLKDSEVAHCSSPRWGRPVNMGPLRAL